MSDTRLAVSLTGLGRFGDGLHPFGDLVTLARARCLLRPGGKVLLGLPAARSDAVVFNSHR